MWFDSTAAGRAVEFFSKCLVHSTGEWAGRPFVLEAWQEQIVRRLFGWKRRDGTRRFRTLYLRVPRKNGKSTLAAGIALYLTTADEEPRADVYGAANDRDQAKLIFAEASRMVKASQALSEICQVFTKSIVVPTTLSAYTTLASDAGTADGLNPHAVLIDEIHELKDRPFYEKLTTAGASRRQPLTVITTTAGIGRHTIEHDLHQHALKVLGGLVRDDAFMPVLFEASPEDDWHDPRVWQRVNPNYGVSVKPAYLEQQHRQAELIPGYENAFKRYHLNLDTEQETRWIKVEAWDRCAGPATLEALKGKTACIGLDLSKRTDLSAMVAIVPEGDDFNVLARFFAPEDGVDERARRDDVPYRRWAADGLLTLTPGNVIDYSYIRGAVGEWAKALAVKEVAYDPYGATQLALQLQDDGIECVEHRQGFISMSEPSKKLEELVLSRRLRHGGNPILRWMIGNVSIEEDAAGNIKPSKRKSTARIDGIVALVMALGRATLGALEPPSVYEQRGIITL